MKICPNCSFNNEDGTKFCIKCGTTLETHQVVPVEPSGLVNAVNPATDTSPAVTPASNVPAGPAVTPGSTLRPEVPSASAAASKKPSKPKKMILFVAALVIVIFAIYSVIIASNPMLRLINGLSNLNRNGASTVDSTVTIKYKGDNDDLKLLNNAKVKMSTAVDMNKMTAQSSLDLLYDNKSIAKFNAGLGSKDVFLDPLKLYSKKFYYELDDKTLAGINELKVLYKYLRQANIKIDKAKYAKIEKEVLEDNVKGSLGKVTLTLDGKTALKMLSAFLEEARDDKQLMESLRKNAQDIMKKIQKDNHTFEVLFDEEYVQDALDTIEDKEAFADAYKSGIDQALDTLRNELDDMKANPEYYTNIPEMEFTFTFGLFQNVKNITCTMTSDNPDTDESVKLVVDARVRGGASTANFNRSGAIDFVDLAADPTKAASIGQKVIKNVITNIKGNKKLVTALEDLTGQDIEDLDTYIFNSMLSGGF